MKNKVSIVIPIYNSQEWLERCLNSLFNQSYKNIEIIAINDGSTDNSLNILKKLQKEHSNMIIVDKKNEGIAKTRNHGIKIATGKYIMFIDNDDFVDFDYVEKYINQIQKTKTNVVIGGYQRINKDDKILCTVVPKGDLYKYKIVAPWAKLYNLKFIKDNNIKFLDTNIGEDIYFNLQVMNLTDKINVFENIGYKWFYNNKSVSNTLHRKINKKLQFEFLLNELYKKMVEIGIQNKTDVEYFFIKTICWYIFYINKSNKFSVVKKEQKKYFNWLKKHYSDYKNNCYISLGSNSGEDIKTKIGVYTLIKFEKLFIDDLILKICR